MRVTFLIFLIICCTFRIAGALYCDRIFQSPSGESTSHTANLTYKFDAPTRVTKKPFKIIEKEREVLLVSGHLDSDIDDGKDNSSQLASRAMHCLYKFVAKGDEKVALSFTSFGLRGDEPECVQEYVDIYVNFKPDDDLATAIGNERPNGRFCTSLVPPRIVSLHNMIVLSIYTELRLPHDGRPLFSGQYQFFKPKTHDQIGPPEEGTLCTHTIYSSVKSEGEFQSVTYPGSYSKNLRCSYKFIGERHQRVRLEFLDLDLYSGGPHCPLDTIKVIDGLDEISDPIIQTICGSHRSLVIFSTSQNILMTFTTMEREAEAQNRGFSAYFEFSDTFFDPNFIKGSNAKHIRGSECDQRIFSNKGTTGIVVSPESKNHPNALCRYIFEGLQNSLDYEKVLIKFIEFDLKTQRISGQDSQTSSTTTTTTTTTTAAPNLFLIDTTTSAANGSSAINLSSPSGQSSVTNSTADQVCPDNYVRLYTGEQKTDQRQDPNDYDYVFCSNEVPATIESDAASLLMEYNSGTTGGQFKAEYKFIVDFRIPGQQLAPDCKYVYKSETLRTGTINSPRYPSWYINDINCTYTFLTKSDEALLLQFTSFKMAKSFGEKDVGQNDQCKGEDSVEISELILDASEQKILDVNEIGTYCGTTAPGPILSYKPVRITLRTNREQAHYGFQAIYNFHQINELKNNEFVANCGAQINTRQSMQRSGTFSSPPTYRSETYEKRNHICFWNITARPSHRIQLDFTNFAVEGYPATRGCAPAAVRLKSNRTKVPIELCGTLEPHRFVSDSEWLIVTFISTKRASGSDGFTAIWTEIKRIES